jgi:hypothetical protein
VSAAVLILIFIPHWWSCRSQCTRSSWVSIGLAQDGGVISTVAGNRIGGFSGDGGPAISARLNEPTGVAMDRAGNLFIADYMNQRIGIGLSKTIGSLKL